MTRARLAPVLLALAFAATASACATQFRSDAHVDATYDFSQVDTFAFSLVRAKVAEFPNAKLLEDSIRNELQARGYQEVPEAEADVLISYDMGVHAAARLSGANKYNLQEGGITVRVMDRETRHTVWYGWSDKTLVSEDTPEVAIPDAVASLFLGRIQDAPR